ncbi:putative Ig domain-containing protein [Caulobacter sp. LARHSG274]
MAAFILLVMAMPAAAADLTFTRAYQGSLSGQTFTTTTALNADAGSIRFLDGGTQRVFQNTSGTLAYTIAGVPHSEVGVLNSRYPNGNTLMNAVAFSGGSGDRLLVLGGSYTTSSAYSGSSNAIVAKLNEYVDATAPDPAGTTLLVNGGATATASVGATATIVVTVKLASGTAVSGASTSLSGSPSSGSSISPASTTTNSSGQATFTVQGLQSGSVTYNAVASANGTTTTSSNAVSVTWVGTRSPAQSTASAPSGVAGRATTVLITVRDTNGNTMTGAASGLAMAIGGTNAGATPGAITDNGNGTYSVTYTPSAAGVDTLSITLDGVAISGSPYSSTVAAAPTPPVITTASLPTPVLGQAYSQTVATTGGTAPVTFAVTGGVLPTGLSLNASTGAITGAATAAGAYSVIITATDANSLTDAKTYSGTISAGVTITTLTLPTPVLGQSYSQTIVTSGGTAPVTFAVTSGALPAGLSLNASTGAVTGTATAAGAYSVTITATDANSLTDAKTYSGTISAGVTITTASLPTPVLGQSYSQTIVTSGGTAPVTFAVTSGALPAGLSLNASTGAITGTATAAGAYSVTITATDANGLTDAKIYSGTILAGVVITTTSLPTPVLGQSYSQVVATSGGTSPVTFAVTGGALPAGLSLNASTGAISGTATAAGAYSVTITATDTNGLTDAETYSGTISAGVTITTASLPTPVLGQSYSQTIVTSGGTAPVTFAVTSGALPAGLSLNASTGAISGTATAAGAYSVTIIATDTNGLTDAETYSGTISAGVTITTLTLPTPVLGQSYSQTIVTSGGAAPVTFAVTSGALPTGLSLNTSTGAVTGAATAAGAYSVTITATDANGLTDAETYSRTISAGVTITTLTLPTPVLGQSYSQTIGTAGGTAPVSFAVMSGGALPAGLSLNASTGAVTGTATAAGAYSVTITATDANSLTDAETYSGTISALLGPPIAGAVSVTVAANSSANAVALDLSGGTAASVTVAGQAGHGVATASGLSITYAPAAGFSGADSFTYTAANTAGASSAATVTVTVTSPSLVFSPGPGSLPGGRVGAAYGQTVAASGGTAPYAYVVSGGGLPTGLSLEGATGAVTGTPTAAGTYTFDVTATDANGASGRANYSVVIAPAALAAPVAGPVSITVAANSAANAVALDLSGGTAASIAVVSQAGHGVATASGLSITYAPTAGFSGSDSFTYTAANVTGASSAATVTVTVLAPSLTFGPAPGALPGGTAGAPYSQTVTASGAAAPYAYVVSGGDLPAGLSLEGATGALTGTPTAAGTYTLDITATDANGATGTASYSVVIAAAAPVAANSTSTTVPANTQTQAGQNVGLNLSSLVSGDVTEVRIVTQPQHGSVVITQTLALRGGGGLFAMALAASSTISTPGQFIAVYTPEKDFQGVDSFEFVAVGPGGVSAPATATITVVGQAPAAMAHAASTTDGKMVSVDLTAGATEGPFTGANLGAISPADAATINLVQGGTDTGRTFRLDVTPKARFGGTITIRYTLTNVFGASSPATVTITVAARPDPSADPVVQAVSDAQAEAARRFSQAQVDNFMRRAERLHGADCLASGNGIRLNAVDTARSGDARGRTGGLQPADDAPALAAETSAKAPVAARPDQTCRRGELSVWTAGSIELSTRDASTRASKIRATSSGLTLGMDARVSDRASLGVGLGYGEDRSRVGGQAGRVSAQSKVVAMYGSLTPVEGMFVDGMVAHGWLNFDTRRVDPTSSAITLGDRDGRFTTISLSSGLDREAGWLNWSSYGRLDYLDGSLDAYREEGAGIFDLRFDRRKIRSTLGVLGLRASYSRPIPAGIVTAGLRGEWRHEFSGGSRQGVDYADVTGDSYYGLPSRDWSREVFVLDPELGILLPSGWELGLAAGLRASAGEEAVRGRMEARRRF